MDTCWLTASLVLISCLTLLAFKPAGSQQKDFYAEVLPNVLDTVDRYTDKTTLRILQLEDVVIGASNANNCSPAMNSVNPKLFEQLLSTLDKKKNKVHLNISSDKYIVIKAKENTVDIQAREYDLYLTLSPVQYDASFQQALFYLSVQRDLFIGSGYVVYCEKENNVWKIKQLCKSFDKVRPSHLGE